MAHTDHDAPWPRQDALASSGYKASAESSYVKIRRCGNVVFRGVSDVAVEEVIIVVGIVADTFQRTLWVSVVCRVCLIPAVVENAVEIGIVGTIELIVSSRTTSIVDE